LVIDELASVSIIEIVRRSNDPMRLPFFDYSGARAMYQNPAQVAAANKVAVDSLINVASTALASAERLSALNLHALRSAIEESAGTAKTLLNANTPEQVAAIQSSAVQPVLANAVSYSRSLFEIGTQAQEVFAKLMQAQVGEFQAQAAAMVAEAAKNSPAGSEVAFAAFKSAIASTGSAFETMNKAARQVSDITESSVNAATATLQKKGA
jgi:phasin family protein